MLHSYCKDVATLFWCGYFFKDLAILMATFSCYLFLLIFRFSLCSNLENWSEQKLIQPTTPPPPPMAPPPTTPPPTRMTPPTPTTTTTTMKPPKPVTNPATNLLHTKHLHLHTMHLPTMHLHLHIMHLLNLIMTLMVMLHTMVRIYTTLQLTFLLFEPEPP